MSVKLLTEHHLVFLSLKGGCTSSSESTLVKMPHCWKSHARAHIVSISDGDNFSYTFKYLKIYYACGCMSTKCIAKYIISVSVSQMAITILMHSNI